MSASVMAASSSWAVHRVPPGKGHALVRVREQYRVARHAAASPVREVSSHAFLPSGESPVRGRRRCGGRTQPQVLGRGGSGHGRAWRDLLVSLQHAGHRGESDWAPVFSYLRSHTELVEPGTDAAFLRAQRVRPWIAVAADVTAAGVAMVSPVLALVLWTLSVIFLAVTSEGVQVMRHIRGRRSRAPKGSR